MTFSTLKKPVWISHRGFKANAVENTARAFQAAVDLGFQALETDLRITKDRHIVLIHDATINRLAGVRLKVRDLTRRELASYTLANGERFLFFDEFAQTFSRCRWILDIKPEYAGETISALADWAQNNHFTEQFVRQARFLTWRAGHENLLKTVFPGADCYARRFECWRAGVAVFFGLPAFGSIKEGRTYALPPFFGGKSLYKKSVVRQFHNQNAKLVAFLPGSDVLAQQAVAAGFDEILTNGKKS